MNFHSLWQAVLSRLISIDDRISAIERTLKINTHALTTIISMEKIEMNTLADVLAKATALGSLEDSVKVVMDGANATISDLRSQLAAAQAQPSIDQNQIDQISTALDKATAVAQAMSAVSSNTPAAAPGAGAAPADAGTGAGGTVSEAGASPAPAQQ